MSHNRTDSIESTTSQRSVELYSDLQEQSRQVAEATELDLLVERAKQIIADFSTRQERISTYCKETLSLDKVATSMLEHSRAVGGNDSLTYVASRIVACEGDVTNLVAVTVTWVTHFLFVMRANHGHGKQPNLPSPIATPTMETTAQYILDGHRNRTGSLRDDLLLRDGYKCVVTGYADITHPDGGELILECTHILCHALGHFDKDSHKSAAATFDILVNFGRLKLDELEDFKLLLDQPSNAFMQELNVHASFNRFWWCLHPTEEENKYKFKFYRDKMMLFRYRPDLASNPYITFRDHSKDHAAENSKKRKTAPIDLPDPRFLAIHAAVAGVLHMSGAGRFFDELLDKFNDTDGRTPVRTWDDLEHRMKLRLGSRLGSYS
ncbi:hypothetical protein NLJ89_g9808 [Agrocybe chaxingu]|uniref:HNH nuclease domain-containing protein n=1 Tax=Agrocybe chaxingu TaxID=84603 RepID=A0A9W8JZB4_9AGAR|nr:hypothetical protein NLJ89_g9808 [Agrocybe chaxingu]